MKKGLLWAILIVLVLAVVLFTLANKDQVEQEAAEVLDRAENVIENVEAELDEEFNDEDEAGDAFEGSEDNVGAEAEVQSQEEQPVVAEVDPTFEAQLEAEADAQ